jgi:hypothetical protein
MKLGFGLAALAVIAAALPAPAVAAEPEPGTPITVAPGVPGHGRAWELVTSPEVVSAQLVNSRALSVTGDRFFYMTAGPLPGAPSGKPGLTVNVAERGVEGWVNAAVGAPYPDLAETEAIFPGPWALSPDLTTSVWVSYLPPQPGATDQNRGLLRRGPEGGFALLAEIGSDGDLAGASADLQHLVFTAEEHLLDADADRFEGASIYELAGSTLRLVDVDSAGSPLSNCGSTIPAAAISRDGRRIFFVTHPSCAGPARVFLREDGTTTTEISASRCDLADCGPEQDVTFVGATPDGARAFLVTGQRLTNDDLDSHSDLYRYDANTGDLLLVSTQAGGAEAAVATEPVRASTDGSRVYFRAVPQLGPGQEGGSPALYLADASGPRLVSPDAGPFVQASANGRFTILATSAPVGPGDGDESVDVYRYDAEEDALTLLSAVPNSGGGPFDARIAPEFLSQPVASHPYRAISEDGSRAFFSTAERLLPEDRNDVVDVYEWAGGSLGLISSGEGDRPASYLGSSPDGATALFRSSATLLPRDRDGGDLDFYAARIGGGFAEPTLAGGCEGEVCRPPPPGRLDRAVPASARTASRIRLRRPGPAARRAIVATGWIALPAEVPEPGLLSARARARIGGGSRTVASRRLEVARAGPVRLRMPLSAEARRILATGRDLRLRLTLRLPRLPAARTVTFVLRAAR